MRTHAHAHAEGANPKTQTLHCTAYALHPQQATQSEQIWRATSKPYTSKPEANLEGHANREILLALAIATSTFAATPGVHLLVKVRHRCEQRYHGDHHGYLACRLLFVRLYISGAACPPPGMALCVCPQTLPGCALPSGDGPLTARLGLDGREPSARALTAGSGATGRNVPNARRAPQRSMRPRATRVRLPSTALHCSCQAYAHHCAVPPCTPRQPQDEG